MCVYIYNVENIYIYIYIYIYIHIIEHMEYNPAPRP